MKILNITIILIFASTLLHAQFDFSPRVVSTSLNEAQNLENVDINGDGLDDILVGGEKLIWLETDSCGQFIEHEIASSPGVTITSRPKDFDNDGDIDFVSSHWDRSAISLWINDGEQNFTENIILENFTGAHDAVIADLNNDGLNDVLCSRGDPNNRGQIILLLNNGDGSFLTNQIFSGNFCHSIDVADFNSDGILDVTSTHSDEGIRIFLNNGDNTFSDSLYQLGLTHFVRTCDLDSDGDIDVLCAAMGNSIVFLENVDGTTFNKKFLSFRYALFLDPVDFNRDGHMDVLFSDPARSRIRLLKNNGDNTFTTEVLNNQLFEASGVCSFDLGNDADIDIISCNWKSTSEIKVWENNEFYLASCPIEDEISHNFVLHQNYPNPFNPTSIISYQLSKSSEVKLIIYDSLGKEVTKLVNEYKSAGNYKLEFNGSELSSGVYYISLSTPTSSKTIKMILAK